MPPVATNPGKHIFILKVKVKVTDFGGIWKGIIVEFACQIWSLYILWFKCYSEVKVDNIQDKNNMTP